MALNALDWLFKHTLRNVWFGIILLGLIAIYIAIGSGRPDVREYFEKDELAFFNAWPLRVLFILLVATLVTVTLQRIPLTPTRLGAWIVHVGIVTLVFGGFYHYKTKLEGQTLIPLGQSTTIYFDRWERSLYARVNGPVAKTALPELPRFNAYDESLGNAKALKSFTNLNPIIPGTNPQGVGEAVGVNNLRFSIIGYWPYAHIHQRLVDRVGGGVGFNIEMPQHPGEEGHDLILMADSLRQGRQVLGPIELLHRQVANEADRDRVIRSAFVHTLVVNIPGYEKSMPVEVGGDYVLGTTGYSIHVESFDPRWQTMDKKIVPLLTIMVKTPTTKFRRQVISGNEKPTDWLLGAEGSGPLGKRQTELLDKQFITTYTYADPGLLQPGEAFVRYTFLTVPVSSRTTIIAAGPNEQTKIQTIDGATSQLTLSTPPAPGEVMTMAAMGQKMPAREETVVKITRKESAAVEEFVEEIPKPQRNKDDGESGRMQVLKVRATNGAGWQEDVLVPYCEHIQYRPWVGGSVTPPGANAPVQLQLSNTYRQLPVAIRLDKFEADAYGGFDPTAAPMMRDFRSTITLTNLTSGEKITDTVYLNSPVFYDGGSWIFFQSGWDNQRQAFTILGVGNRPGVYAMATGCALIIFGIFYAFYIKPVIIKINKQRALDKARLAKAA